MANVFQRGGKGFWVGQWVGEDGRRKTASTKTTDKRVAIEIARQRETVAAKRREGLIDPAEERYARQGNRPLSEHLADFHTALLARDNGTQHCEQTHQAVDWILRTTKATRIADLSPSAVQEAVHSLRQKGRSARTANSYLAAAKQFSRWLRNDRRSLEDALATMAKYNERGDRRHERRILSPEEMGWVLVCARECSSRVEGLDGPTRAMIYQLAASTGFRAKELRALAVCQFDLIGTSPAIRLLAHQAKNAHSAVQPISMAMAAVLREWLQGKSPDECPFRRLPRNAARMFRWDLASARAAWINESSSDQEREARQNSDFLRYRSSRGLVCDFHALRAMYISAVMATGASVKTLQVLARHKSPSVTLKHYARSSSEDLIHAVNSLQEPIVPDFQSVHKSQFTEENGRFSESAATGAANDTLNRPECDTRLNRLIEAWPTLPDQIKESIVSLLAGAPA